MSDQALLLFGNVGVVITYVYISLVAIDISVLSFIFLKMSDKPGDSYTALYFNIKDGMWGKIIDVITLTIYILWFAFLVVALISKGV